MSTFSKPWRVELPRAQLMAWHNLERTTMRQLLVSRLGMTDPGWYTKPTSLDATPLKEGSGKELRTLHDTIQQHVRVLKSVGYKLTAPFVTSAIELKLNETTMFEWQSHSQKSSGVPHYHDLLDFIHLCAQATGSRFGSSAQDNQQTRNA